MSIGFVSRDQTNLFKSCVKALSPMGIPTKVTDDNENDDIDITQQTQENQQRQRRRPTTRSPATIAADRLVSVFKLSFSASFSPFSSYFIFLVA